jgi:hypothetical protein
MKKKVRCPPGPRIIHTTALPFSHWPCATPFILPVALRHSPVPSPNLALPDACAVEVEIFVDNCIPSPPEIIPRKTPPSRCTSQWSALISCQQHCNILVYLGFPSVLASNMRTSPYRSPVRTERALYTDMSPLWLPSVEYI